MSFLKVLLVNPSPRKIYDKSPVKLGVSKYPPLNLLTIATPLLEAGHSVKIFNFDITDSVEDFLAVLKSFKPDVMGLTFTTPLYTNALELCKKTKHVLPNSKVIVGGAHPSFDYKNLSKEEFLDFIVVGEGDFALLELFECGFKADKVYWQKKIVNDLDDLPIPAFQLIKKEDYSVPHMLRRKRFVARIETSRGCVFGCVYCSKHVFGRRFRHKSPDRVLQEIRRFKELGYQEFHLADDGFTTNMDWAESVCDKIIENKLQISWSCMSGVRADRVNLRLLKKMKKAGCYRVSVGVETGSEKVLKAINKGLKLDDVRKAFKLFKKAKIESFALFMFGLPDETEEDMQLTIDFAKEINPDFAKFGILVPLPATPIFETWKEKYITSLNWEDYSFYSKKRVFKHPLMSDELIWEYYSKSYKEFYFRPKFILQRVVKDIFSGNLLNDTRILISFMMHGKQE